MEIDKIRHIYFLGIGGIGMSALARYFLSRGKKISGYDKVSGELTIQLEKEGMDIHYNDDPSLIPADIDLVVITPAIPQNMHEFEFLRTKNIPVLKRAEVLGMISRNSKCLAVAGTHGKTTTSTLLAHILRSSGIDCSAFLGGIAVDYQNNYLEGSSDILVAEADEYDRSFLQLHPSGAIITSVDPDHLDIYGNEEEMKNTYSNFASQIADNGSLVFRNGIDIHPAYAVSKKVSVKTYGVSSGDCQAVNIKVNDGYFVFDYISDVHRFEQLKFSMPGRHNVENACGAIALGLGFGASEDGIRKALSGFKGIKRRFEFILRTENLILIDDYAHHPAELKAAVNAARELYPEKKITGIFQPHLYSRTRDFADDFAASLDLLDKIALLPVYPARELPIEGVDSRMLFDKMKSNNKFLVDKEGLAEWVGKQENEVVLILGAGDIDRLVEPVKRRMLNQ